MLYRSVRRVPLLTGLLLVCPVPVQSAYIEVGAVILFILLAAAVQRRR